MHKVLITGGAGFIGCNLVDRLLGEGTEVTIYDNLSRKGVRHNLEWLASRRGKGSFRLIEADVRDFDAFSGAIQDNDVVYHLAGQVAVTSSVVDPRHDFESNALGTLNALEALRKAGGEGILIYASTNKVYGGMEDVAVVEEPTRYRYQDFPLGIPETHGLDFHSPYGCSKGAGDQYVRDYARIYGLRTVVFRQSCICGPRQMGIEDQGWLAWFVIAALTGRPITIYGDGKQIRDILFVSDLLDVYQAAIERIDTAAGQIYNVGGGPENTLSIWSELGPILEDLISARIPVKHEAWRPGDQPVYVSDIRKAKRELEWQPAVTTSEAVERLYRWVTDNLHLFPGGSYRRLAA